MALSFGLKAPKPTGFSVTDPNFSDSPEDPRTMGGPQPMSQTLAPAVRPRPYAGPIPQRPKTGAEEFINTQLSTRKLRSGGPNGMRGRTLGQLAEKARTGYAGMSPDQRKPWEDRSQLKDVRSPAEQQAQTDYENRVNSLFNPSFAGAPTQPGTTISSGTSAPVTDPSAVTAPAAQPDQSGVFAAPKPPDMSPMTTSGRTLNEQNAMFPVNVPKPVPGPTQTTFAPDPAAAAGIMAKYAGPGATSNASLPLAPKTFSSMPATGTYAGPGATMITSDENDPLLKKKRMLAGN